MSDWDEQLDALSERLNTLQDNSEASRRDLQNILQEVCNVVRAASKQGPAGAEKVLEKAEDVIDRGIKFAFGSGTSGGLSDFMLSFAHGNDEALLKDKLGTGLGEYTRCEQLASSFNQPLGQGTLRVFYEIFGDWIDHARTTSAYSSPLHTACET